MMLLDHSLQPWNDVLNETIRMRAKSMRCHPYLGLQLAQYTSDFIARQTNGRVKPEKEHTQQSSEDFLE